MQKYTISLLLALSGYAYASGVSSDVIEMHLNKLISIFPKKVLDRYLKDHNDSNITIQTTKYARAMEIRDEWIKYAFLARHNKVSLSMFSDEVDNMWHTFLIFNKDYEEFCAKLDPSEQDKSILYHIPFDEEHATPILPSEAKSAFVQAYKETFGYAPKESVWKKLESISNCSSVNCQCNQTCSCSTNR